MDTTVLFIGFAAFAIVIAFVYQIISDRMNLKHKERMREQTSEKASREEEKQLEYEKAKKDLAGGVNIQFNVQGGSVAAPVNCPNCGAAFEADAKFCKFCGAKAPDNTIKADININDANGELRIRESARIIRERERVNQTQARAREKEARAREKEAEARLKMEKRKERSHKISVAFWMVFIGIWVLSIIYYGLRSIK